MLKLQNLTVIYPDKIRVIDNLSFTLNAGENIALIGENGAGKTSLLLAIAGVLKPAEGTIETPNQIGLVFQNPDDQLFMPLIYDDVAFGCRNLGLSEEQVKTRVEETLEQLNIGHLKNRSSLKLSYGEKRMAAIATVLSMNPSVLMFDEPTAYLDPRARRLLIETLKKLQHEKIIATHDMSFAAEVCNRIIVLKEGSIVADGKKELLNNPEIMQILGVVESSVLNTLILAAGLGTRLRPLTERIAKPLIPIVDNSPLGRQVALAKKLDAKKIHANAHHLAEQVQNAAAELGINKVWVETELLGTGGPIWRMHSEGERGELLVLNGDCEHNLNVEDFLKQAQKSGASCALLAIDNPNINTLCINKENSLCGIKNKFGKEEGTKNATFTGISWYSSKAWEKIKESERDVRDFWERLCKNNEPPFVVIANGNWLDIGSPETLMQAINDKFTTNMEIAGSAGSGRKYYRMKAGEHSLILQQSHNEDLDFERFVRYGKLFGKLGLPVPEIYAVSESEKRVVMEDFGAMRLFDAEQPMLRYPAVLEKLIVWQEASEKAFELDSELANRNFDEKDYLWETCYFAENYLGTKEIPENLTVFFSELAKKAAAQPKVLMHRDFQSQNIMLKESKIGFIDFQGARKGSIYYDVASLLQDPYMMIPQETVKQLFSLWHQANPLLKNISFEEAWENFIIASQQRIMQALGAYCFLSKKKGIKSFEQYIEPGAKRLKEISIFPLCNIFQL